MVKLKFVLWNMEWLNALFVADDQGPKFHNDDYVARRFKPGSNTKQRKEAFSNVLAYLSPDVVVAVEGPSRQGELQLFFDSVAPGQWRTMLQGPGSQSIGIAVRMDQGKFKNVPLKDLGDAKLAGDAFQRFTEDIDDDGIEESYKFIRKPLYVEVSLESGKAFRVLGLHLKSKGIFEPQEWSKWWKKAEANRKKLVAEATHLRREFLDVYLQDPKTKDIPLIVCGDVNDGPGFDAAEQKLFKSGIEQLMGTVWRPELALRNAIFDALPEKHKREMKFTSFMTTAYDDQIFNTEKKINAWIDHILYTDNYKKAWVTDACIYDVPLDAKKCKDKIEDYLKKYRHASDHAPVSVFLHV